MATPVPVIMDGSLYVTEELRMCPASTRCLRVFLTPTNFKGATITFIHTFYNNCCTGKMFVPYSTVVL
jgi:hypothetical protein